MLFRERLLFGSRCRKSFKNRRRRYGFYDKQGCLFSKISGGSLSQRVADIGLRRGCVDRIVVDGAAGVRLVDLS